jgi:hypothetical protein
MEKKAVNQRRTVRANIRAEVTVKGSDITGKPFLAKGMTFDFSRRGMGITMAEPLVSPGAVIHISLANQFQSNAVVQWVRREGDGYKVGVRIIERRTAFGLQVTAALILMFAFLGQISFARDRGGYKQPNKPCTIGMQQMQKVLEAKLKDRGGLAAIQQAAAAQAARTTAQTQ